MRTVTIDFNTAEVCGRRTLGFVGEHNATELVVIPPAEMTNDPKIKFFKLAFSSPCGAVRSENLHKSLLESSVIKWSVPDKITKLGSTALQLEAYGENGGLLAKTRTLHGMYFCESVSSENDFDTVNAPIKCGVEVTATDSDGNAVELIIYGNLPAGVTVNGSKLEKITLHGMTEIPAALCEDCTALREVQVIGSVLTIGENAFGGCKKLENITPFESLKHIGNSAFYGCAALEAMPLPDTLEAIGDKAFSGCAALKNIVLPESIGEVGSYAFAETGLTEIAIPSSCSWGEYCFKNSSLEKATISEEITELPEYLFIGCKNLKSVTLPDGLTSIGEYAFCGCSALEEIQLPESLISLGASAFYNCKKLDNVSLNNVVTIGNYAFYGCEALKRITLTDGLTSIGEYAFQSCYGLSEISMPDSVTSLGRNAFYNCRNLSSIKLSKNITSLPKQIFDQTALTEIDIPDNIESVGWYAFAYCTSLRNVTIGNGVTYIDSYAFSSCNILEFVRIKRTSPPTLASYSAFPYSSSNFVGIYVPKSEGSAVLNAYKTATNWKSSYLVDKIFEWEGEE